MKRGKRWILPAGADISEPFLPAKEFRCEPLEGIHKIIISNASILICFSNTWAYYYHYNYHSICVTLVCVNVCMCVMFLLTIIFLQIGPMLLIFIFLASRSESGTPKLLYKYRASEWINDWRKDEFLGLLINENEFILIRTCFHIYTQ